VPRSLDFRLYAILLFLRKGTDLTDRLYYRDAFLREFDAQVVSCEPEGGRWKVVLDKTAFYPTSGGQPHDLGRLGDAPVVEVVNAEGQAIGADNQVVHYTSAEVPLGPVHGHVDWTRRLDHMQQHTAQHLLSAAFIELFGFQTVSFHLGKELSTIDLSTPSIIASHLEEVERRTNEIIFEDRPVVIRFGTAEELAEVGIRKQVEREGILRAIEIEGFDRQPCGGTHLERTGQAGSVLIRKLERRRDLSRVEFVAGYRALAAARRDFALLTEAGSLLSCGIADVPAGITKTIADRRAQAAAANRIEERLALLEARALLREHDETRGSLLTVVGSADPRTVAAALPEASTGYLGLLAARLAAVSNVVALLVSRESGHVVFAQSKGLASDLGAALREGLKEFGGKGGGSRDFAQGGLPNPADADAFLARALQLLKP
jgi:alanyl-tRNA synthetase